MTPAEVRQLLNTYAARVQPTLPLEIDDVLVVREAIRAQLSPECGVECYHNHREILVKVWSGGKLLALLSLPAK